MDKELIRKEFKKCRLPVRVLEGNPTRGFRYLRDRKAVDGSKDGFYIDVRRDGKKGETFDLFVGKDCEMKVLGSDPKIRHLLIMVESRSRKDRYLLGHDERQLFVSSLENSRASNIEEAFDELQPEDVKKAKRQDQKVIRQGEWFFVPAPEFDLPGGTFIQKKVSIRKPRNFYWQSQGNPHTADELVRVPVETEDGKTGEEVYVRGRVRHGEHATIKLHGWHRVYRNLEEKSNPTVFYVD